MVILLAIYFGFVLNFPFNKRIFQLSGAEHFIFSLTPGVLLIGCFLIIFSLFPSRFIFKPLIILLLLSASAAMYATLKYSVLFDYSMVENVFETNSGEALSYINAQSIYYVLVFGAIPSVLLIRTEIAKHEHYYVGLLKRLALIFSGIFIIGIVAVFFYKDYASVGRNNRYLNKMINPAHVYNAVKYIDRRFFTTPLPYHVRGVDAQVIKSSNHKPTFFVVVLGETARAQNFAYNGYTRNTNPYTQGLGIISLEHVSSCGTATAHSLPCMFSSFTRNNYSKEKAMAQDNVLDVISHAGVDVTWYDNDGGDKNVAKHVIENEIPTIKSNAACDGESCYDQVLVDKLSLQIKSATELKNQLVVLHTMGSHGPTYFKRYPADKEVFKPACRRRDIENCSDQYIVNVYDNTLVYTDFILSEVIKVLKDASDDYNVAMIYLSDHGESLGENGLYLHGTPYAFAPKEQTHIPWLMWLPKPYTEAKNIDANCLKNNAKTKKYSHDNLFHSLLGLYGIKTAIKDKNLDITEQCSSM